jgi:hypothetical protein
MRKRDFHFDFQWVLAFPLTNASAYCPYPNANPGDMQNHSSCASPCQSQDCSADAIYLKNLVVSKVQSLLHLGQDALLHQVIAIAATRFATHTVCNKWLVVITITGLILLHHFIILLKNNHPVPKQQVV